MADAHFALILKVAALSSAYAWRHRTHRPIAVYLLTLALCDALRAAGVLSEGLDRLAFLAPPVALLAAIAVVLRNTSMWIAAGGLGGMAIALAWLDAGYTSEAYTVATVAVLVIGGGGLIWEMRKR